ncbi:MAG: hypothetical protein ACR2L2_12395 [Acidobacteriota bacterium]
MPYAAGRRPATILDEAYGLRYTAYGLRLAGATVTAHCVGGMTN